MAAKPYDPLTSLPNYGDANQTYAALTRQQFSDWANTFMKFEDKLYDYATDPTQAATAMESAKADVNSQFDLQGQATERRLRPLGPLAPDEQLAMDRSTALARGAASAGAQNRARDVTLQRQQAILGNPTLGGI